MPPPVQPVAPPPPPPGRILYASYQTGPALPGFVRYALAGLARTGWPVALLTNRRELDETSRNFLAEYRIELFLTENSGFDFGMWRRYLDSVPEPVRRSWTRLLLINDSVVYFRDVLPGFLAQAEAAAADLVSLTANPDFGYHLQSFFLYLKPRALELLFRHLAETPDPATYDEAVKNMEIGLSRRMLQSGLVLAPLFQPPRHIHFSYETLIRGGAGFVKRRFMEKRFGIPEMLYFWKNGAGRVLDTDFACLIREAGHPDPAFRAEWLRTLPEPTPAERRARAWRVFRGRVHFFTFFQVRRAAKRYRRYATPAVLAADAGALVLLAGGGLLAGYVFGWPAGLAALPVIGLLARLARRLWRRWHARGDSLQDLTLVSCSFNTPEVTAAMLQSYVRAHPDGAPRPVLIMENSTDDRTAAWLATHAIPFVRTPGATHHASVDPALARVRTRYALLVDTDIVFLRNVSGLFREFRRSGAALGGVRQGPRGGFDIVDRIVPWFCFLDVQQLRAHELRFFIPEKHDYHREWNEPNRIALRHDRKNYDVASELLESVREKGLGVWELTPHRAKHFYRHFEGMSWRAGDRDPRLRAMAQQATAEFQACRARLALDRVAVAGRFR